MGLTVSVFKSDLGDCSNGGLSGRVNGLTLVNVSGPSEPTEDRPAALLVRGNLPGCAKVVGATEVAPGGEYVPDEPSGMVGPMMGGCYVGTSDSRFSEAVAAITGSRYSGAVPLHDRFETPAQYDMLSR